MPIYVFECPNGHVEEVLWPMRASGMSYTCPLCKQPATRAITRETPRANNDFTHTVYSEALGVHPSQITDAKRRFPHHNFTADGRMILANSAEVKRVRADLGWDSGEGPANLIRGTGKHVR